MCVFGFFVVVVVVVVVLLLPAPAASGNCENRERTLHYAVRI